jgi:hypothetical protein
LRPAVARGGARWALQVLDLSAQAVSRGGVRCASQGCVHLSWCPGRCPRRRSLCVEPNSSLRPAVARGTAQVVGRARGGARCASRVLDRGAQADARGAARCFSQVLDRCAQVIAAAPLRCRNRRRTTLLMCSGKYSILPGCSVKLSRCT